MERKALVYYRSDLAGYLSETDDGYHFLYDTQYLNMKDAKPISLTLPIQKESFESKALFSFFGSVSKCMMPLFKDKKA